MPGMYETTAGQPPDPLNNLQDPGIVLDGLQSSEIRECGWIGRILGVLYGKKRDGIGNERWSG
jgi:hypothetical protein